MTPSDLRLLVRYDPESGILYWLPREVVTASGKGPRWNARYAGKPALNGINGSGYKKGRALGCNLRAHRVVWALAYGVWPEGEIDHIDGDKTNNRLANLRDVSHRDNCRNVGLRPNNTSGHNGISWNKPARKWIARVAGRHLGVFDDIREAVRTRDEALASEGYHPTHGRQQAERVQTFYKSGETK